MKNKPFEANEIADISFKVGDNIRHWKNVKGINSKTLASLLGIGESALSKIETNKSEVSLTKVIKIANCLSITLEQLLSTPNTIYHVNNSPQSFANTITINNAITPEQITSIISAVVDKIVDAIKIKSAV